MGQFMSNKYLRYSDALKGRLIENDKPCCYCAYNLRGLRFGGRCPECGSTIIMENSMQEALATAPMPVMQRLRAGFWMAMFLLPLLLLLPFIVLGTQRRSEVFAAGLGVIAVAWFVAVWMMTPAIDTPAGIRRGFGGHSPLRWSARLLQFGWIIAAISLLGAMIELSQTGGVTTTTSMLFGMASAIGTAIGLAGIVTLAILMRRLAEWCSDDVAGKLLDWTMVGVPLCAIVIGVSFSMQATAFFGCFFMVLLAATMVGFATAMALLGRAVTWSVHHAHEIQARDVRRSNPNLPVPDDSPRAAIKPGEDDAIPLA